MNKKIIIGLVILVSVGFSGWYISTNDLRKIESANSLNEEVHCEKESNKSINDSGQSDDYFIFEDKIHFHKSGYIFEPNECIPYN